MGKYSHGQAAVLQRGVHLVFHARRCLCHAEVRVLARQCVNQ